MVQPKTTLYLPKVINGTVATIDDLKIDELPHAPEHHPGRCRSFPLVITRMAPRQRDRPRDATARRFCGSEPGYHSLHSHVSTDNGDRSETLVGTDPAFAFGTELVVSPQSMVVRNAMLYDHGPILADWWSDVLVSTLHMCGRYQVVCALARRPAQRLVARGHIICRGLRASLHLNSQNPGGVVG